MPLPWDQMPLQGQPPQGGDFAAYLQLQRPDLFQQQAAPPPQGGDFAAYLQLQRPDLFQQQAAPPPQMAPPAAPRGTMPPMPQAAPRATPQGATQAMLNRIGDQQLEALRQQGLSVEALQKQLGDVKNKQLPMNLSPLAALADAWTGSKLSSVAQPAETAQSRDAEAAALQGQILKAQQGMSQDEIQLLKDKLTAQYHSEDLSQREADRQVQREAVAAQKDTVRSDKLTHQQREELQHAQDKFNNDTTVKDTVTKRAELDQIRNQINQAKTDPVANNMLPIALVKLYVNRVSNQEVGLAKGSQALTDRAEQFAKEMSKGTLTEKNAGFMQELVDGMQKHGDQVLSERANHYGHTYSKLTGLAPETAIEHVSGGMVSAPTAATPPKPGDIIDGHRFKGGDPSKKSSWEMQ